MEGEKATSSKTKRAFERNLSFLAFLEAGQIKVSRVLNWGPVPPFSKCAICTFGSKISLKIAI